MNFSIYGLLIAFGILAAILFAEKLAREKNLNAELFWRATFWTIIFGIIGARLYHIIDFWEIYGRNLWLIPQIWHGGLGIFGALIAGGVFLIIFLKKHKQNVWLWLDIFALPIPLAQAIGRLGNYFNHELLPYAIYEASANLVLFATLILLNKRLKIKKVHGNIFLTYLIGYSIIRLFLERFRTDSWTVSGLNVAQFISILLVLVSATAWLRINKWTQNQKS